MAKYESGRHRFLGQNLLPPEQEFPRKVAGNPAQRRRGDGKESGSPQCSRKRAREFGIAHRLAVALNGPSMCPSEMA